MAAPYVDSDHGLNVTSGSGFWIAIYASPVVVWSDGLAPDVDLYGEHGYEGNVCGVLGDWNGNAADDLVTKDGTDVSGAANPGKEVGDSWIVRDDEQPDQS
jgi:hypothetical protein